MALTALKRPCRRDRGTARSGRKRIPTRRPQDVFYDIRPSTRHVPALGRLTLGQLQRLGSSPDQEIWPMRAIVGLILRPRTRSVGDCREGPGTSCRLDKRRCSIRLRRALLDSINSIDTSTASILTYSSGTCQVLTIPPRSSALRVLGNRCVPTSPLCSSYFDKRHLRRFRLRGGTLQDPVKYGRARQAPVRL